MKGVDLLLGNDLAGAKVVAVTFWSVEPTDVDFDLETRFPGAFPSCAVTRSRSKKETDEVDLYDTFLANKVVDGTSVDDHSSNVKLNKSGKLPETKYKPL